MNGSNDGYTERSAPSRMRPEESHLPRRRRLVRTRSAWVMTSGKRRRMHRWKAPPMSRGPATPESPEGARFSKRSLDHGTGHSSRGCAKCLRLIVAGCDADAGLCTPPDSPNCLSASTVASAPCKCETIGPGAVNSPRATASRSRRIARRPPKVSIRDDLAPVDCSRSDGLRPLPYGKRSLGVHHRLVAWSDG